MKTELERSYVFASEDIPHILNFLGIGRRMQDDPYVIVDNYLNSSLRIRHTIRQGFVLTKKTGDKRSNRRLEEEQTIDQRTATILTLDRKLHVVKKRYHIFHTSGTFEITLDIVQKPMKIAILEIESTNEEIPPTAEQVFGKDLIECPLSAWNLFRQKIGICGAPSSGKTETAKMLSNLMNVNFDANSFHVLEYATSFIQKYDRHPNAMDQFMLWYSQRAREEDAASKSNIVISDSPTFLSYIYMLFHNGDKMSDQFKIHLAKLYKRVLEDIEGYSKIIYLRPKNLVDDNIRFHNQEEVYEIASRICSFLECHNIPFIRSWPGDAAGILDSVFFINNIGKTNNALH